MKRKLLLIFLLVCATGYSFAKDYKVSSPDGKVVVTISTGTDLKWSAACDGKEAITSVKAGMVLGDGRILGHNETVRKVTPGKINQILEPVVAYKRSRTPDNCNTLLIAFKSGINNDTYKYYIDFASKNGIEYIILDEGWYKLGTLLESVTAIDVPELCKYGESKNVGIILWVVWKTFWDKIDEAVALYEKWGVKGVKVDFMQRDDQKVLDAKTGDYLLIARRSGNDWFVGGMTDWSSRELELDLSFLAAGTYNIDIFQDGINADRYAQDYRHLKKDVKSGDKLKIEMAPGGGWVAKISLK